MNNLLTQSTSAVVLAIAWIISTQHIVHSKSLPGEGFTAGALLSLALLLSYVVLGYRAAHEQFPPRLFYLGLLSGGFILLALTVVPGMMGESALTAFELQLFGLHLSSTLIFDLALFLMVVCSLFLAINRLTRTLP